MVKYFYTKIFILNIYVTKIFLEEEEVPVSEVKTVVRKQRHIHDTENGKFSF